QVAGWCSWLSRMLNTHKVLGSSPSLVITFFALLFFSSPILLSGSSEWICGYLPFAKTLCYLFRCRSGLRSWTGILAQWISQENEW
ncbi:hypothetical protein BDV26DRAFT_274603, partial [Aspergillus bertholletiae]